PMNRVASTPTSIPCNPARPPYSPVLRSKQNREPDRSRASSSDGVPPLSRESDSAMRSVSARAVVVMFIFLEDGREHQAMTRLANGAPPSTPCSQSPPKVLPAPRAVTASLGESRPLTWFPDRTGFRRLERLPAIGPALAY